MKLRVFISIVLFAAISRAATVPVSRERVLAALNAANLPLEKSQVQMLSEVSSKNPAAALQVADLQRWNESDALIELRCPQSGQCLPFYVRLHWSSTEARELALAGVKHDRKLNAGLKRELLVRAGQKATLVTKAGKFRAATPVICMDAGSAGQTVRVASLDRKRIARAEVIENGVLKGSF
jgi:hypothetical protein